MSFLRSGSNASSTPSYTQVQLQTSSEGICLTLIYGVNRVAPNLIWMDNFQKHGGGGKKGGGKGGGKGSGSATYTAALMLAVCEGPVNGFGAVYVDNTTATISSLGMTVYVGDTTQTPFGAIASAGYVPIAYRDVCYLATNNYDLGASATVPMHAMEIYGFQSTSPTSDINPSPIIFDVCTNTRYGLGMPADQIGDRTLYETYCTALNILISPVMSDQEQAISIFQRWAQLTNSWIFWSENLLKFVPLGDATITAHDVTFVPVTTIQYDLTEDDFVPHGTDPPLEINRADPSDSYNWVKVEISDRLNQYSTATMEYKDQTSIMKYGLFQANDVQANEVCDRGIGGVIAGLIGARANYIRNVYTFTLPFHFCLLEPGDIVTVNDSAIGLVRHPVRIRTMDEDQTGMLKFTAEECPAGSGTAASIGVQPSAFVPPPTIDTDPGPVNTPTFVEPPATVTGGAAQIWIGASGASTNWGGADVFISVDDVTYVSAGVIILPTPQGVLIDNLALHADPDTVDTLSVDFTESLQILSSAVTPDDADAARSLILVNQEVIGFGTVVPNALNSFSYDISYLRRGTFGTTIAAASIGDPAAVMLPAAMLQLALPEAYVGQILYFKFTSFNLLGGATEDISLVTRYEYVPTGVIYTIAPPTAAVLSITTPIGASSIAMTLAWAASPGPSVGSYEVQLSEDSGGTWTAADVTVGGSATQYTQNSALAFVNYQGRVRAISASGIAISTWATSAVVNSGPAPPIGDAPLQLPLVNGDIPIGIMVDPDGVPVYVVI